MRRVEDDGLDCPLVDWSSHHHLPIGSVTRTTGHLKKVVVMPARNGGYWSDKGYEW